MVKKSEKITKIVKRNGRVVNFDKEKIVNAIFKAAVSVGGEDRKMAEILADKIYHQLELTKKPNAMASVEEVQALSAAEAM